MFNTLEHIDKYVYKDLDKNLDGRSYSGMFKTHRMKVPLIGDFPVLAHIAYISGLRGKSINRHNARTACRYSSEWNALNWAGRTRWMDLLLEKNREGLKEVNKTNE